MPAWIHDRADHIRAKNPSMSKSESFAIATQQSHALGKSPKNYGTPEGRREAKMKYTTPGDDKKTASIQFAAFSDELQKIAMERPVANPEDEAAMEQLMAEHVAKTTGGQHLRTGLSALGGATAGGGIGAGMGYLGGRGLGALAGVGGGAGKALGSMGAHMGAGGGAGAGGLLGALIGGNHGQHDIEAGQRVEQMHALEQRMHGG